MVLVALLTIEICQIDQRIQNFERVFVVAKQGMDEEEDVQYETNTNHKKERMTIQVFIELKKMLQNTIPIITDHIVFFRVVIGNKSNQHRA